MIYFKSSSKLKKTEAMNKVCVQKKTAELTADLKKDQESNNDTTALKEVRINKRKRSLSSDDEPPRKKRRVSEEDEDSTSFKDEIKSVRGVTRKTSEEGEGPGKQAKERRRLLHLVLDKESSSSSVDTDEESNNDTTAVKEVRTNKKRKRSLSSDDEPPRKKRRVSEEDEVSTSFKDEIKSVRGVTRKTSEEGEGPGKQAKERRRLLHLVLDKESSSSSVDIDEESNNNTTAVKEVRTNKKRKRSLSSDDEPPRKKRRVSEEDEDSTSFKDEIKSVRGVTRKTSEEGEGPGKQAKERRRLLHLVLDKESSSSSVDIDEESNNNTTALKEIRTNKKRKRSLSSDDEPPRKKRRVSEEDEDSTSFKDEIKSVRGVTRKTSEEGEGPGKQAKERRRLLHLVLDKESSSSSVDIDEESNNDTTAVKEVRTNKKRKRSLSSDDEPPRKKRRVSEEDEDSTSFKDELKSVRGVTRKTSEEGEGPGKQAKERRRLLHLVLDKESSSSSVDIDEETSSSNIESHSAPEGDKRRKNNERKANDAEEAPGKKTEREEDTPRDQFKAKYEEQGALGQGGCGYVFAGYRKSDNLPVAIKHIQHDKVFCRHRMENGTWVSVEVAVMLKLQDGGSPSAGQSTPVSLLDWYDMDQELVLVLERPVPAGNLSDYIYQNRGSLDEDEARMILKQLLDVALHLERKKIFHRDIHMGNILIETGSNVPRVRLIDFGLSCFTTQGSLHRDFYGTTALGPPEWLRQHIYTAGPTTVWQLGVVLFNTVHREDFLSTQFLMKKLTIRSDLSTDCRDFLDQCLKEDPEDRPTLQELQRHPWLT